MADYNAVQNQVLPDAGAAVLGGLRAGQDILKNQQLLGQTAKLQGLQQAYLGATDEKQKQAILQQMAVYNPEHAKGIAAIGQLGVNPFEGTSMEAQKANLQYQRYIAAGLAPGEARIKAINDAASTGASFYTDELGRRITQGGIPLPDVGGQLGAAAPTQQRQLGGAPLPAYGTGDKPSQADKVVSMVDSIAGATPEEKAFVQKVMNSPNPAQAYAAGAATHPDLPPTFTPEIQRQFQEINAALTPESIKTGGSIFQPPSGLEPTLEGITSPLAEKEKVQESVKQGYKTQAELQDVKVPGFEINPNSKPTKDDAKKLKDIGEAKKIIETELNKYKSLVEKHGSEIIGGAASNKMQQHFANMIINLKTVEELGVLNPNDREIMEEMIPNATDFTGGFNPYRQENVLEGLKSFQDYLDLKVNSAAEKRGYISKQAEKPKTDIKSMSNDELLRMLTK